MFFFLILNNNNSSFQPGTDNSQFALVLSLKAHTHGLGICRRSLLFKTAVKTKRLMINKFIKVALFKC